MSLNEPNNYLFYYWLFRRDRMEDLSLKALTIKCVVITGIKVSSDTPKYSQQGCVGPVNPAVRYLSLSHLPNATGEKRLKLRLLILAGYLLK